jgi:hypothetical protein
VPAVFTDEVVGFARTPRATRIGARLVVEVEDVVDDAPGLFDAILARKAPEVAGQRVIEKAFVGLAP